MYPWFLSMRGLLFCVERLETLERGQALLVGRCCCDAIKAGDEAQVMVLRDDKGRFGQSEPLTLQFPGFEMFGLTVRELAPEQTAGVRVPLEVARGLRFGWYLMGENP